MNAARRQAVTVKYLITGATGFIGIGLVRALSAHGAAVLAVSRRKGEPLPGVQWHVLDLARESLPGSVLNGVDVVFHLAGVAHRQGGGDDYRRLNYQATLDLAAAAARAGVRCFVFVSSVKAMGPATDCAPRRERDCLPPADDYGHFKWQAESALRSAFAVSPMGVVILRPALVYGSGVKGNLAVLAKAVRHGLPRPPAGGGRSMVSLPDFVRLLCDLAETPVEGVHTWIVCDGEEYSFRRIHDALRMARGLEPAVAWWPLWIWRVFAAGLDVHRRVAASGARGHSFDALFGCENYSNAALLAALPWRPQHKLEDLAEQLVPGDSP